ncbi:MAG TPA: DNA polymerase IV [Planctomycetota bacterium]|nr:DNA polymerase IV [Planctomycetota bacterium]
MAERAIIHVDMDAFYASVEVLDDPKLAGLPVVVGGRAEDRGVIAAASYEARKFGVHSAMSTARALRLCPKAVLLPPRFDRYGEMSGQVFAILREYTPLVEPLSIDEAFLDVTGCERLHGPAEEIGRKLKRRIREETRLTASVGVAPNKFLAKLASDLRKPDGFLVIAADEAPALLAALPVSRLWGVGRATEEILGTLGVRKIGDLFGVSRELLERRLGTHAADLLSLARGIDDRPVVPDAEPKSIGAETTFPSDIGDAEELLGHIDRLVERVARELREAGYEARTVHLKARYPDFSTVTRARTLPAATDRTAEIRAAARELFRERLDRRGRPLRLIGVSLSGLVRPEAVQGELFADPANDRARRFDRAKDELRAAFGPDALRRGSQVDGGPEGSDGSDRSD